MELNYRVRVFTFNQGEKPSPFQEITRLSEKLRYQDEIEGLGVSPCEPLHKLDNPRNIGGWICRNIGEGERYKRNIADTAITALIDSYIPFIAVGSIPNPGSNCPERLICWEIWHSANGSYSIWVNKIEFCKYPEIALTIPQLKSYHAQSFMNFDSTCATGLDIY